LFATVDGGVAMDVACVVQRVLSVDVPIADHAAVKAVLSDVAGLRRWLDGVEVACMQRLDVLAVSSPSIFPERDHATATRDTVRRGNRAARRAKTAGAVAQLGDALTAGDIAGDHIDVVTAGLSGLTPTQRQLLAAHGAAIGALASGSTPDDFRRELVKLIRQIQADDGVSRLERQRRAVRLRTWIDKITGMVRISGELDPVTGALLIGRLNNRVETLFHDKTPDLCPDDRWARQQFLRAHALLDLTAGTGGGAGKVEMTIVIDLRTLVHGWHDGSRVDCGLDGVDLPIETIRRMAVFADIVPVLLDENGVVLKMGRTRRLATRDQRRALRAMYRWCAIPGCRTPVGRCEPHHCDEWEHGGNTDIDRLVPICNHDHDVIHAKRWVLSLAADRSLTVTAPDGTIMTTGPPSDQWT
jgi:hypothetical protein